MLKPPYFSLFAFKHQRPGGFPENLPGSRRCHQASARPRPLPGLGSVRRSAWPRFFFVKGKPLAADVSVEKENPRLEEAIVML